jgi:hypothetical protein
LSGEEAEKEVAAYTGVELVTLVRAKLEVGKKYVLLSLRVRSESGMQIDGHEEEQRFLLRLRLLAWCTSHRQPLTLLLRSQDSLRRRRF